ncbi:NAD(P)/FAD-dependent oxidoreductase [Streptomyces hyaluromycini]|uniref:NAD(P)/FAD-dependent oxidoreductase n=1 Tax=Streptomyces hyaluromycini TaxID=1377993 RepID=UPI000B5C8074|nr:FAD-dependent oxidoreductase [Streptomyces hyaluromycini]
MTAERHVDVLVVGAGPAGLAAAARLAVAGAGRVEVLEREQEAGGVPRYCAHGGFGTWTRPLTGPAYARLLVEAAARAGAVVRTGVTVLDWAGSTAPFRALGVPPAEGWGRNCATSHDGAAVGTRQAERLGLATIGVRGPETVTARAVVLATGAYERPRAARLIPGTRPAGIHTGGELLQAVHRYRQPIGERAVVVGAEDVSYAAAGTVRAAGAEVVAMVTDRPRAGSVRALDARLRSRVPLLTGTTVTEILGHGRLSGVRIRHRDGRTGVLACDTVVLTGDFAAEDELARRARIALAHGPYTDRPGVFAAGGLRHPGLDVRAATREGVEAGRAVLEWLVSRP